MREVKKKNLVVMDVSFFFDRFFSINYFPRHT